MTDQSNPNVNAAPGPNETPDPSGYQLPHVPVPSQQPYTSQAQSFPGYHVPGQAPQPMPPVPPMPPMPPQGYIPPATQQPYQAQQPPYTQSHQSQQQPPYPPYSTYPPAYNPNQQPPKKKVWPWVLAGCLLIGLLGLGGCVSCVAFTAYMVDSSTSYSNRYADNYDYGYNGDNGSGNDGSDGYDSGSDDSQLFAYSYDEIMASKSQHDNTITDGSASNGVYEVGKGKDLAPGRYFIEGSQTSEGTYIIYTPSATSLPSSSDSYSIAESIVYFGNYFVELEAGEIILFTPAADEHMMPADKATFEPTAPYASGLYLVGTDIPAGTYKVTSDSDAASNASSESAAFVMKDLAWSTDSITNEYYVIAGSSHTVSLKEGQWVEAYAVILTPTETKSPETK